MRVVQLRLIGESLNDGRTSTWEMNGSTALARRPSTSRFYALDPPLQVSIDPHGFLHNTRESDKPQAQAEAQSRGAGVLSLGPRRRVCCWGRSPHLLRA